MRKNLLAIVFILTAFVSFAQKNGIEYTPQSIWKYSSNLTEEELYNYNRLLYMSREDWDLFRQDPRYDQARVSAVYMKHKDKESYMPGNGMLKMTGGDCDCWIDPDFTYTMIDPTDVNDWINCGGGAGQGVDCWYGPIDLGFDFCFYGTTYNSVYLTTKGTVVFGGGYYDWTPSEFPNPVTTDTQYNHLAAFWADADYRQTGMVYFKVEEDALYVNYMDVGYFANHGDKTNSFQIVITPDGSDVLNEGANVQYCYGDMNWCHGDIGGSGGCSGPTPATVGADKSTGNEHIQFGRFGECTDDYNGPYGQNNNQVDGVNWLDNKTFEFSVCDFSANVPPISTAALPCDTIYLCQGDVYTIEASFLSPESNQTTTITFEASGQGFSGSSQNGNIANFSGTLTAGQNNLGVFTVDVVASDNGSPVGTTALTYTFLIQDITLPALSIDGVTAFCAGGETDICATEGFDSYQWEPQGCDEICCHITNGGTHVVTGFLAGCSKSYEFFLDEQPYFIPALTIANNPICPGENTTICTNETYASYEWSVYPGFDGEVIGATDQQCVTVSANFEGHYLVTVTDETGCEGQNIPVVVVTQNFIDESNLENAGPYCDGDFSPVTFQGGYSAPGEGVLKVYCVYPDPEAEDNGGWGGCYLLVTVTNDDLGTTNEYICTTDDALTITDVPIIFGDYITVEFVCNDNPFVEDFYAQLFNCDNQGDPFIFGQEGNPDSNPLEPGTIIWEAFSACEAQPLMGTWDVTTANGTNCWTLSSTTSYDTQFTPCGFDVYTLCFNDPACNTDECYELIYTEAPEVAISNLSLDQALFCPGEEETVCPDVDDVYDPAGTGVYDWSGPGVDEDNNNCAVLGPYTGNNTATITLTLENECGEASDVMDIEYYSDFTVVLEDGIICAEGNGTELDPVASDNDFLSYSWDGPSPSISNSNDEDAEVTVNQSGTYSVEVENECFVHEAEADITISQPIQPSINFGADHLECDEDDLDLCIQDIPAGYTISWTGGGTSECINVNSSGSYTVSVTDPLACETLSDVTTIQFADLVTLNPTISELQVICPGQEIPLTLGAENANGYSWTSDCDGLTLSGGNTLNFGSASIPADCLGSIVTVTGTASGLCNTESASFQFIPDPCFILIPNVFTPGNDSLNNKFEIVGLENYDNTQLYVYNRWGGEVYSSDDYENDWQPGEIEEGTYYYVLILPFGTETERKGYITIIRD
jgi:gliding motility-associated-like protein